MDCYLRCSTTIYSKNLFDFRPLDVEKKKKKQEEGGNE